MHVQNGKNQVLSTVRDSVVHGFFETHGVSARDCENPLFFILFVQKWFD